jgi:hypothetical protein
LEFDLSGLPYSTINADFLTALGKVLRFEGLLKYVALPRLTVEDDELLGTTEINTEEVGANTVQEDETDTQTEASKEYEIRLPLLLNTD